VLRVGVVGLGIAGGRHLAAYASDRRVQITAVSDVDRSRGEDAAERFGASYYHDYEELLESDVDAVSVCVPHSLLAPVAVRSAQRGKHVLLEKPMATSVAEADSVIAAFEEWDTLLMVGFVHRFRDEALRAKEALRQGAIGEPYLVIDRSSIGGDSLAPAWIWDPAQSGGGVLFYSGVHSVDRVRWLAEDEVAGLTATTARLAHVADVEDYAVGTMRFGRGLMATFIQNFTPLAAGSRWDTEVYGSEGSLFMRTGVGFEIHTQGGKTEHKATDDLRFLRQAQEFVSSIAESRAPCVGGADGRAALAVVEAMYRSSEGDQGWVSLD
jgi:UDP-N-acetylglucosamine 3-dehydrogenase